jgi:hypothetical protein
MGVDRIAELADQAIALGVLDGSADLPVSIARDAKKLAAALRASEKLQRFVEAEVRDRLGLTPATSPAT